MKPDILSEENEELLLEYAKIVEAKLDIDKIHRALDESKEHLDRGEGIIQGIMGLPLDEIRDQILDTQLDLNNIYEEIDNIWMDKFYVLKEALMESWQRDGKDESINSIVFRNEDGTKVPVHVIGYSHDDVDEAMEYDEDSDDLWHGFIGRLLEEYSAGYHHKQQDGLESFESDTEE